MSDIDPDEKLEDGTPRYRLLDSGATYDNQVKQIVKGADWTSEEAAALARRRYDLKYRAAVEGLAKGLGLGDLGGVDDLDTKTVRAIFEKAGELMRETTNARNFAELARFATTQGGLLPKEAPAPPEPTGISSSALDKLYTIAKAALDSQGREEA